MGMEKVLCIVTGIISFFVVSRVQTSDRRYKVQTLIYYKASRLLIIPPNTIKHKYNGY